MIRSPMVQPSSEASSSAWPALVVAIVMAGGALAARAWYASVRHTTQLRSGGPESSTRPRDRVVISESLMKDSAVSPELFDAILRANPFSPQRRQVPPATSATDPGSVPSVEPAQLKFRFKGRIQLGTRQRAILEEVNTKKTHFLEVGQEVAGFKVLDITETQVVLSHPTQGDVVVPATPKP